MSASDTYIFCYDPSLNTPSIISKIIAIPTSTTLTQPYYGLLYGNYTFQINTASTNYLAKTQEANNTTYDGEFIELQFPNPTCIKLFTYKTIIDNAFFVKFIILGTNDQTNGIPINFKKITSIITIQQPATTFRINVTLVSSNQYITIPLSSNITKYKYIRIVFLNCWLQPYLVLGHLGLKIEF